MSKKALIGVAIIAVLALVATVGSASAATAHKVSFKYTVEGGPQKVMGGTFKGQPFGKGTIVEKEVGTGEYDITFKAKDGTATFYVKGAPTRTTIKGKFRWLSGTGKYEGIKGKGSVEGAGLTFTVKGTATY